MFVEVGSSHDVSLFFWSIIPVVIKAEIYQQSNSDTIWLLECVAYMLLAVTYSHHDYKIN